MPQYSKNSCSTNNIIVSNQNNNNYVRRSAKFQPSTWSNDYIQSITTQYGDESYLKERDGLKEEVRMMISKMEDDLDKLELVDVLQKSGVASHFKVEISNILQNVYNNCKEKHRFKRRNDLYATALLFRLLRQYGYHYLSPEIFRNFQDDEGKFNTHLSVDNEGILSLYEASFHAMEGESILDEARDFCLTFLKDFVVEKKKEMNERSLQLLVNHALELPLHWRVPRLESLWFIDFYEKGQKSITPTLLKLAKLDFNIVQATHQEDLKYTSRWWKDIGLREKLSFARDMPMESFFWTMGVAYQPEFGYFRREMTKLVSIINIIDDIYDVYGTFQELQLFTQLIDRWDVNAVDSLPEYMKICFLALHNFVNQIAFDFFKQTGYNIILYLKKGWGDLCKSYMREAKWYYNEYIPSLEEYLENAWISGGGAVSLLHSYFLIPNSSITLNHFDCLQQSYPNLFRHSATILRLANDLVSYQCETKTGDVAKSIECYMNESGASEAEAREHVSYKRETKTGDVAKSIECYMNESGASEDEAREHVHSLICETWIKMNEEVVMNSSLLSPHFLEIALNMARMALCMYQYEDRHTVQDSQHKNPTLSLLIQPIPINY